MAILSRILGKMKAKPKTLDEQIDELDGLSDEVLAGIAVEDESEALRLAATDRLGYGPVLIKLAFDGSNASVHKKARQRIAGLIDKKTVSLDQLTRDGVDEMAQFAVVGFCEQDDLFEQLLNSSDDEDFFYRIALEGVSIKLRQLAAEKIKDESRLQVLLKETKGKDKQVHKIVKEKCDGFRKRDQLAAQAQVELTNLCERLEKQSKRPFDKGFSARVSHLQEQWTQLQSNADEVIAGRARQAFSVCQQTIDTYLKQQADAEALVVAVAKAAEQQAEIMVKLKGLLAHLFNCAATEEERLLAERVVEESGRQWLEANEYKSASQSAQKAYTQLNDGINFQIQQLQQHGSLSDQLDAVNGIQSETPLEPGKAAVDDETETSDAQQYDVLQARIRTADLLERELQPQSVSDAVALISQRKKQGAEKQQAEKSRFRHIGALMRKAQSATDAGQSRPAAGIRRKIEEKIIESETLPAYLSKQLEQLDTALEKLLDWKDYVVEPKKQQLIEQMQALVDSSENPDALATKIRRLQDEWKGVSKGTQDESSWEVFHELAQRAYQPCKVFFDQQAEIRSANLDKRIQLVAQLKDYLLVQQWGDEAETGVSIDWNTVEKLIATAIKEWRSYAPVERNANKKLQQEFDHVLNSIKSKLHNHYQKNADLKRQMIEQVQVLADHQDNRKAIEEVKRLQGQWKLAGAALRKDEQSLWKAFRKGCDVVFEKRQQQTEAFKAELEVNKDAALAVHQEVEGLLGLSGKSLLDARERVVECQQEFRAVGSLPKAQEKRLKQAFNGVIEKFDERVAQQLSAAKEQVWLDLLTATDKIRQYQIVSDEGNTELAGTLEQKAKDFISGIEQWPKGGLAALEKKMAQEAFDVTQEDNELALRMFCIRAEILCDLPTPDEDKALRMEYQVSRLANGLGQNVPDKIVEMNAMTLEWVLVETCIDGCL